MQNLFKLISVITLLLSSYIPGSPSVDPEVCIDDPDFVSKSTSILMFPVFWWIAADISAHVILTVFFIRIEIQVKFIKHFCCSNQTGIYLIFTAITTVG